MSMSVAELSRLQALAARVAQLEARLAQLEALATRPAPPRKP
jgi:hypothetical protein